MDTVDADDAARAARGVEDLTADELRTLYAEQLAEIDAKLARICARVERGLAYQAQLELAGLRAQVRSRRRELRP